MNSFNDSKNIWNKHTSRSELHNPFNIALYLWKPTQNSLVKKKYIQWVLSSITNEQRFCLFVCCNDVTLPPLLLVFLPFASSKLHLSTSSSTMSEDNSNDASQKVDSSELSPEKTSNPKNLVNARFATRITKCKIFFTLSSKIELLSFSCWTWFHINRPLNWKKRETSHFKEKISMKRSNILHKR